MSIELIVKADGIFQCYNGDRHPLSAKCDGIVDCVGGSFEDEPKTCGIYGFYHDFVVDVWGSVYRLVITFMQIEMFSVIK